VRVAVTAGAAPADTSPDWFSLGENNPFRELPLSTASKIWARGLAADSGVRIYRISV
jgi:hypothetical protein